MVHLWYRNDLFDIIHDTIIKRKLLVINYTRYTIYVRRLQIEYTASHHRQLLHSKHNTKCSMLNGIISRDLYCQQSYCRSDHNLAYFAWISTLFMD